MLHVRGGTLVRPEGTLASGTLVVADGRIVDAGPLASAPTPDEVVDAEGLLVAPGFIDLQVNGAFGHDFTAAPDTIWPVAAELPRYGVTAFLPTIITSPLAAVAAARTVLTAGPYGAFRGATPLGLHLEGPFLNPGKKGAHNPAYLQAPDRATAADWSPEQGVRLVTLAPELPGAAALIGELAARGVVVSAGHSLATYDEGEAAVAAGVRYGTHLFNAMTAVHHRDPGLSLALLDDDRVTIGLIPDGLHVHPALVRLVWERLGPQRLNVVTDAMAALGMPPGTYQLGDHAVTVDGSCARLESGTLAGCIVPLDEALRNLVSYTGCTLAQAIATVTTTPARLLGIAAERGTLRPGAAADFVLLTPDLEVMATYINGVRAYRADDPRNEKGKTE